MSSIFNILAGDKSVLIYRPELRQITDSVTASILLTQLIYWHQKSNGGEFYKFKEPCNHPLYKSGSSWCEELAFSRKEFDAAYKKLEEKGFVSKRTTIERVTFYRINSETLSKELNGLFVKYKRDFTKSTNDTLPCTQRDFTKSTKGALVINTETTNRDYITETTTEITSENLTARENSHAQNFSGEPDLAFEKIEQLSSEAKKPDSELRKKLEASMAADAAKQDTEEAQAKGARRPRSGRG